ncbi:MAG: hypothetical protein WDN69_22090 [Aliidongia sp.]
MQAEGREFLALIVEEVEENKGLEDFAQIARAHQAGDVAVALTAGAVNDGTGRFGTGCSDGHGNSRYGLDGREDRARLGRARLTG